MPRKTRSPGPRQRHLLSALFGIPRIGVEAIAFHPILDGRPRDVDEVVVPLDGLQILRIGGEGHRLRIGDRPHEDRLQIDVLAAPRDPRHFENVFAPHERPPEVCAFSQTPKL